MLLKFQVFSPVEFTVVDVKLTPCDSHFQKYNFGLLKSFNVSPLSCIKESHFGFKYSFVSVGFFSMRNIFLLDNFSILLFNRQSVLDFF